MTKKIEEEDYEQDQEVTELDLIYELNDRFDALIELLMEKKIITEKEYNEKLDEIINEKE